MKPFAICLMVMVYLTLSLSSPALSSQDSRTALIIGNGAYKSASLRNPENDANDMTIALRKLGFDVTYMKNARQRDMEDAIRFFGRKLRNGGVGLFFYAGHGMQVNGKNYLIPIGTNIKEETDIKYEAVDANRILDAMHNAGNGLNIVILDACRDNPYARSFRSSSNGLARMDAPKGTLIAYSTSPGKVAADGTGRNSPYIKNLLQYIDAPGLTIEQVFKRTRRQLDRDTEGKQIPWESTSLTGDFYFNPARAIAVVPATSEQSQEEVAGLFSAARNFFRNIEKKDYTLVWDAITVKSRETIINTIYKNQKKTGVRFSREGIMKDFDNCGVICKSFWDAYFSTFDPELALEQSKWDIGSIKKNKAEILITHRSAESPAKLKMFKESGSWKIGFTETFWTKK